MSTAGHMSNQAVWLINGLESGTVSTIDALKTSESLDPVLVYFTVRFLREKYPATRADSEGVLKRLADFSAQHQTIIKVLRAGEKDPIREWFDDAYTMRDFFSDPGKMVEMLVEKIEG
jgi:hypothetical protein